MIDTSPRRSSDKRICAEVLDRLYYRKASDQVSDLLTTFLQNRLGLTALRAFHEDIAPLLMVDWIMEQQHMASAGAVLAAGRKKLSLVDCTSFDSMRKYGVRDVFCFDRHFREQGFEVIP
jgi:predicted nucleic acid-binding protein